MKISISKIAALGTMAIIGIPSIVSAQGIETISIAARLVTFTSYVSLLLFFIATVIFGVIVHRFGKSTLGSVFYYLFIGTGIFVFTSLFFSLGAEIFGISEASLGIWLHLMFNMAFLFYFYSSFLLVRLSTSEADASKPISKENGRKWSLFASIVFLAIFSSPQSFEPAISNYVNSSFNTYGLHYFITFAIAGLVAIYLARAKKDLGMIAKSIANPIIIAVSILSLMPAWGLLSKSWGIVKVGSDTGAEIEKIFLLIAGLSICYGAWRLMYFLKK